MRPYVIRFLLVLPLGVAIRPAAAQESERKIHVGVMGGGTLTNLTGSGTEGVNLDWRGGFIGGGWIEYELSKQFALALEGSVLQKGARQKELTTSTGVGYRLWYVEFPVLLKFNLSPSSKLRPTAFAGPAVAFETDCKQPVSLGGTSVIMATCFDTPERETTEFSGQVGFEVTVWGPVSLGARYSYALSYLTSDPELRNHGFAGTVGVRF